MDSRQIQQMLSDRMIPDAGKKPGLIETHISWVILGNKNAYKIKKPVKYSFLDFSTFYKRKKYCELEIELNKRLAPAMYLDVVPVIESNKKCRIGGEGIVIDFAVRMKRMQNGRRLDNRIAKNQVSKREIVALAQKIAAFHARQKPLSIPFDADEMTGVFNDIGSVLPFLKSMAGHRAEDIVAKSVDYSNQFLNSHIDYLKKRVNNGFIRDIHGDLHSANIFMYASPVVFDCIEFNDSFRQIDVLNEAAFFCMDMEVKGRSDLAATFLQTYLAHFMVRFEEPEQSLFQYYKIYRANVKIKVNALKSMQATEDEERSRRADIAIEYLDLLDKYLAQIKAV